MAVIDRRSSLTICKNGASRNGRVFQTLGHVSRLQSADHFSQITFNHAIEVIKGQADAMIGHTILRKVIGADLFLTAARADLAATLRAVLFRFFALFSFEQTRAQNAHRLLLVLELAASVLAAHD